METSKCKSDNKSWKEVHGIHIKESTQFKKMHMHANAYSLRVKPTLSYRKAKNSAT